MIHLNRSGLKTQIMSAPKRSKLSDGLQTVDWDPTQLLPPHICDNIARFLPKEDLLNASLVSKSWHETFGKSKVFRDRMRLKITESMNSREIARSLQRTGRKFEKVELCSWKKAFKHLWLEDQNLKDVSIKIKFDLSDFNFELESVTESNYTRFLEQLKLSVSSMSLWCPKLDAPVSSEIVFPKLTDLNIAVTSETFEAIKVFDAVQPKLQTLETLLLSTIDETMLTKCFEFIGKQSQSLEQLYLYTEPVGIDHILDVMIKLKNLKELFVYIWADEDDYQKLSINPTQCHVGVNESLNSLSLYIPSIRGVPVPNFFIKKLLCRSPNIEKLHVEVLTTEVLEFCARRLPKLKTLKFGSSRGALVFFYRQLKLEFPEVNSNIQLINGIHF